MNFLHSTIAYFSFFILLLGSGWSTLSPSAPASPQLMSSAQLTDSLALVALNQSTVGSAWTIRWNLNQPVHRWYGVELDNEGYVVKIQLNSNNLQGSLPNQIGDFRRLEHLQLDNNQLRDTIPAAIGDLSRLTILFLDNNELIGQLPNEMGDLGRLQTLFLDNNQLTGAIPQTFTQLTNLWTFDIFNNHFDSLPDLSGINLQRNRLRIYGNRLTFDDILPNLGDALGDNYIDQDSFFQPTTYIAPTGQAFVIDLGIDAGIVTSSYQWYKNGVPFGAPINNNQLQFPEIGWGDAGVYHCVVTNPLAPLLTLYSRAITLRVECGHSYGDLRDTLCADEQRVINGITFNASNPRQDIYLPGSDRYGCDSTLRVDFFVNAPATGSLDTTLCAGESLFINGRTYDQQNLSGTERFFGGAANGCDSLLTIQLQYFPRSELQIIDTLCTGTTLEVNGTIYDENNPSGTEIIPGGGASGCDSTILIDLDFSDNIVMTIASQLCPDEFITVNNNRYDRNNPSGSEMLQTQQGCDSLIQINLSFYVEKDTLIQRILCENDFVTVGNERFDQSRPTGLVQLTDRHGCDSIVRVDLQFESHNRTGISELLCYDETRIVNGSVYDRNRPSGTEILPGASATGCDSIITVDLQFRPAAYFLYEPEICEDDFFIYNGRIYDQTNDRDTIILPGRAAGGCDSIVDLRLRIATPTYAVFRDTFCANEIVWVGNRRFTQNNTSATIRIEDNSSACDSIVEVDLYFLPLAVEYLNDTLCDDDQLIINGTTYDADNPVGMEFLPGATAHGCDSTILIDLHFAQSQYGAVSDHLCDNEERLIGGELFNRSRSSGTVTIPGAATNGCDSIIFVDLSFGQSTSAVISDTLCPGASVFINGNLYDENRPAGLEVIPTGNLAGCDSTVTVDLNFHPSSTFFLRESLCPGESLLVNGVRYDVDRLSGVERINNGSVNGCDSIIDVSIQYYEEAFFELTDTLCPGITIEINGTIYNESNPAGTEVLRGASVSGCDSTVNIDLSFYSAPRGVYRDTLCPGTQVNINGTIYDEQQPSGTEVLVGTSSSGCDSIVSIQLHFYEEVTTQISQVLCPGESLLINGTIYNESRTQGIELIPAGSNTGCDSTVLIDITYRSSALQFIQDTICAGETYTWNNQLLTQSGSYYDTLAVPSLSGCDSIAVLELIAIDVFGPLADFAGADQETCPGSTQLNASLPTGTLGTWENREGLSFSDINDPQAEVFGLEDGSYTLYWLVNSPQCQLSSVDSMTIYIAERPIAVDDQFTIPADNSTYDFNVLTNDDTFVLPSRQVELLNQPAEGTLSHLAGGKYRFGRPGSTTSDSLEFQYRICNDNCIERCDTASVLLVLEKEATSEEEEIFIPNGITPNDDGLNDAFVIPVLDKDPDRFPQSELIIFNRWGQVVFQQNNYQNDWRGTDPTGKALAAGTYYYVLRLNVAAGLIFKGDLTIIR